MTQDAQSALRRTMETYSKITRFCLVCNYVTRIIDPLASRCSKFRFKSLNIASARARLEHIAEAENVPIQDGVIQALVKCSDGDLRKAITFLQSAARLVGVANTKTEDEDGDTDMNTKNGNSRTVTVDNIHEIAGIVPDDTISSLLNAMQPSGKSSQPAYSAVANVVTGMVADGWSAAQVVGQLYDRVLMDENVPRSSEKFDNGGLFGDRQTTR